MFNFQVVSDAPFISPSEIDLLNKLCQLGKHYRHFEAFIQKYGHSLCCLKEGKELSLRVFII